MRCKYKNIVHRHILYVAKTYFICCKDKIYVLQRQNVYVIKTNLYVIKTKFICYKDNIYVIKTKFICYKDKMYML